MHHDLNEPPNTRDHVLGSLDSPLILLEYGDYQCPDCAAAHPVVEEVRAQMGDRLAFIYRHFPLTQIHSYAASAAEAAEAADAQGAFWRMHNVLFARSPVLAENRLVRYAAEIDLDEAVFTRALLQHTYRPRVQEDMVSGVESHVHGTPTFFINGALHRGDYDLESLLGALRNAEARLAG